LVWPKDVGIEILYFQDKTDIATWNWKPKVGYICESLLVHPAFPSSQNDLNKTVKTKEHLQGNSNQPMSCCEENKKALIGHPYWE